MRDGFRHARHVLRVSLVFALGFIAFLVIRRSLIPSDFGVYGYYRAGALNEIKARPIAYAGRAACEDCHAGTYDDTDDKTPPLEGADLLKDNKHAKISCEACHEPLAAHAADPEKPVSKVASDRLCLGCHLQLTGRPATQPQVVPGDHGDNDKCVSCHKPHRPKTDES